MPHAIHGFLLSDESLIELEGRFVECASPVPLRSGMAFIPITADFADELDLLWKRSSNPDDLDNVVLPPTIRLTKAAIYFAKRISREFMIAYIETEYHGGDGYQLAAVWTHGRLVQTPSPFSRNAIALHHAGPINRALARFGVQPSPDLDRFATVGLTWYRDMSEFESAESDYYDSEYLAKRAKEWGY